MNPERFRTYVFMAVLALALGLCLALVLPFVKLVGWAVVLTVIAYPVHSVVCRVVRHPSVAAGMSCFLVVAVVLVPASFLVLSVAEDATTLARDVEWSARQGELPRWADPTRIPAIQTVRRWLERRVDLSELNLTAAVSKTLGQAGSLLAKRSMEVVRNALWFAMQLGLALVTVFFLLRDGPKLLPAVHDFIPLKDEQTQAVLQRAQDALHATVYGATLVAVTQGTLGGLGFWALGLPSPLLWGTVTTALCFVPLLGAPAIWIPTALWLLVQGLYWKAIGLTLIGALVVGLVDNLLRPVVIGTRAQLHTLVVFFSVLGGLLLMGPLGLLLGPVILSVTLGLLEILKFKLNEGDAAAAADQGDTRTPPEVQERAEPKEAPSASPRPLAADADM